MNRLRIKPIEESPLAQRSVPFITKLNIALAAVSLCMMVYYVVQSNGMAVQVWRARDAQERLATLQDVRNGLVAQEAALDDREQLMSLATNAGMVPAGSVVYLVEQRPVAAR
jgi:hypothetical protein